MKVNLLWFRRDLRIADNWLLQQGTGENALCLPFFIVDPYFYNTWSEIGGSRVRFLFESLEQLNLDFQSIGGQFYLLEGNSVAVIENLLQLLLTNNYQPELYFHRDRQISYGLTRDTQIVGSCQRLQVSCHIGNNNFLILNESRMNTWRSQFYDYQKQPLIPTPEEIRTLDLEKLLCPQEPNRGSSLVSLSHLKQKYTHLFSQKSPLFDGGSSQGLSKLKTFIDYRYKGYHWKLSQPFLALKGATSQLSPHIMWGTLSVRQINKLAYEKAHYFKEIGQKKLEFSLRAFLDRLRWHESFTQRLYFHPELAQKNWYSEFDSLYNWQLTPQQEEYLHKWKEGQTGFPLVDASMRQLQQYGWLNFRMRAMVVTFLCINCGVSWFHGAKHFMNCLVDGDIAINHWQWQMQAGITNPLAKTIRIYNPEKSLQDKDPNLEFVNIWLPELKGFNLEQILAREYLGKVKYPQPMLDFLRTRRENGKKVAEIREQVRKRLTAQQNGEWEQAKVQAEVVDKYQQRNQEKYRKMFD